MTCTTLANGQYILGWLLAAGGLICYAPQWIKIIQKRSHAGLDLTNFCMLAFVNTVISASLFCLNFDQFPCCTAGLHQCAVAIQPIIQGAGQTLGTHLIVFLYFVYYDNEWQTTQEGQQGIQADQYFKQQKKKAILMVLLDIAISIPLVVLATMHGQHLALRNYGTGLSLAAGLIVACHWQFQIAHTFRMKSIGSLSVVMLGITSVGSYVTCYSWSLHGGWELWVGPGVGALMQTVLVLLCAYLACRPQIDSSMERKGGNHVNNMDCDPLHKPLVCHANQQ
jgi:uncharacterized protein with PQ loop repeat